MMNHTYEQEVADAAAASRVDTNTDVEDARDREVTARELRACLEALRDSPDDSLALAQFSAEMRAVAQLLLPQVWRVVDMHEEADKALDDLNEVCNLAIDYLDACALIAYTEDAQEAQG